MYKRYKELDELKITVNIFDYFLQGMCIFPDRKLFFKQPKT